MVIPVLIENVEAHSSESLVKVLFSIGAYPPYDLEEMAVIEIGQSMRRL